MQMEDLGPGPPSRGEPPAHRRPYRGLYEHCAELAWRADCRSPPTLQPHPLAGPQAHVLSEWRGPTTRAHIVHLPDECDTLGEVHMFYFALVRKSLLRSAIRADMRSTFDLTIFEILLSAL